MEIGAHVAQSVEHFLGKEEVTGSIPVVGSMILWIEAGVRPVTGNMSNCRGLKNISI
jgi:hypothetical protein